MNTLCTVLEYTRTEKAFECHALLSQNPCQFPDKPGNVEYRQILFLFLQKRKSRVSTEIIFVEISKGIPFETYFDIRRNNWSKLSKVIGISISTVGIEITISNQNINFIYFGGKC
jgi:hypothetical protein